MSGMDHSNMSDEEMKNMEGMDNKDSSMENGHASHNNPLALNNSTGENELALPPIIEPKNGIVNITAQKERQKSLRN